MNHGILSHHCCCGKNQYTQHIVTLDRTGCLVSVELFTAECANTLFCDDYLIVTASDFEQVASLFLTSLRCACKSNGTTPIGSLIASNGYYTGHMARIGMPCHIYALSHIDKATLLPTDIEKMALQKL